MKFFSFKLLASIYLSIGAVIIFSACSKDEKFTVIKPDQQFFAVTSNNQLMRLNANAVETPISTTSINGLQTGENILAIDFRPATGELYAVTNTSRLYIINTANATARVVGTSAFNPAISGTTVGFDFNPTVDRIRLVTSTGQNLRLHPET